MPSGYVTGQRYDTEANGGTIVCRNQRPQCPRHIPQPAKRVWARVVPILADDGVLATIDATQLANMCVAQAILERLQHELFRQEQWVSNRAILPAISLIQRQQTVVTKLINDFGMSLRARAFLGESLRNSNLQGPSAPEDSGGVERVNPRLQSVA